MQQADKLAKLFRFLEGKKVSSDFSIRLGANFPVIYDLFLKLYPSQEEYLTDLLNVLYAKVQEREELPFLQEKDNQRSQNPNWYSGEKIVAMMLYVDLFNQDLEGLKQKIEYFKKLGVNTLHLMPLLDVPQPENDGGYAVKDYRKINPSLGNFKQWNSLLKELQNEGFNLMIDFVLNHCADEHEWALKAKKGNPKYQNYFYIFPDRTLPDEYEKNKLNIFPETAPGDFTYNTALDQWVMTLFHQYQWDLNYQNPEVLIEMIDTMLFWANKGVDLFRLDAVAYMWKEIGKRGQNLPEVHTLLQLFKLCGQVIAPAVGYVAEAIVSPKEIVKYFGEGLAQGDECDIAYNASFMALTWEALATKDTRLLYKSMYAVPRKPQNTTWINYARCHDDIGLGFEDRLIEELGKNPKSHRQFLIDFYCHGGYGSDAKGQKFMYDPITGDARISGSMASLCGLEKALEEHDEEKIQLAIKRINLQHSLILSLGGIPMLYSGDELGTCNDYTYEQDLGKKQDNRWLHRPKMNWDKAKKANENPIFQNVRSLIALRKKYEAFADTNNLTWIETGNHHLLAYVRENQEQSIFVVANFSDYDTIIPSECFKSYDLEGLEIIHNKKLDVTQSLFISKYDFLWIR